MIEDYPKFVMACEPFLQRLGWSRVRPRQNSTVDIGALQSQRTPIPYPHQNVGLMPSSRTLEPQHGLAALWPWPEEEIDRNGNSIHFE